MSAAPSNPAAAPPASPAVPTAIPAIDLAPKSPDVVRILHLSDLHLASVSANGTLPYALDRLEQALSEEWRSPFFDLLFVTGDVAHNNALRKRQQALAGVFDWAKSYLTTRLCPQLNIDPAKGLFVIPGNHDVRWSGLLNSYADVGLFNRAFAPYMRHAFFPAMNLLVACFDSNRVKNAYESARGLVRMEDFGPLSAGMTGTRATAEVLKIALVHHHPLPVPGSEVDLPEAWYEQVLRTKLVGLPQSMVLLNSGTFLQRLLDLDFRLVIHGHLHHRGYWRAHNTAGSGPDGGQDGWIEAISGGSMGSPPGLLSHSFAVISVHRDGLIECTHHGFDAAGNAERPPRSVRTAPYSLVRERGRRRLASSIQPVHCQTYVKTWQVDFATAGLVTLDRFRGMSAVGREAVPNFYLSTQSLGLTSAQIEVVERPADVAVAIDVSDKPRSGDDDDTTAAAAGDASKAAVPADGKLRVKRYRSTLTPALTADRRIDLTYRRVSEGVVYRSVDDKRRMESPDKSPTDGLELYVDLPVEQLLVRVQFVSDVPAAGQTPWLPSDLKLVVLDRDEQPHSRETDNAHVVLEFSASGVAQGPAARRTADAVLTVHRPRLGFVYGIEWKLPPKEMIPEHENLVDLRRHLLAPVGPDDPRHKADKFAESAKAAFAHVAPAGVADPELHAYLFAFDADTNRLACRGTTASTLDPLVARTFRYGFDLIGTSFRRRGPMGYLRDQPADEGKTGLRDFDQFPHEDVTAAFASPIKAPDEKGWPVGIVLFATRSPRGPLHTLLHQEAAIRKLSSDVQTLWVKHQDELCPLG